MEKFVSGHADSHGNPLVISAVVDIPNKTFPLYRIVTFVSCNCYTMFFVVFKAGVYLSVLYGNYGFLRKEYVPKEKWRCGRELKKIQDGYIIPHLMNTITKGYKYFDFS